MSHLSRCWPAASAIAERLGIGFKSVEKVCGRRQEEAEGEHSGHAVAKALMFNIIQP